MTPNRIIFSLSSDVYREITEKLPLGENFRQFYHQYYSQGWYNFINNLSS